MKKWKWTLAATALAGMLAVSACGGGGDGGTQGTGGQNGPAEEASEHSEAMSVYKQKCMSCHGAELRGRSAPSLEKVGAKYSREELATIITEGRGGMPSFSRQLDEAEIGALADWLAVQQ